MTRLNIIVEGQAEETLVNELLAIHLAQFGTAAVARRVEFSRKKQTIHRGGLLEYPKLRKDVVNWLNQDRDAIVTTMVDLYALPDDFPKRTDANRIRNVFDKVAFLETAFAEDLACNRFIPNIQLHEFEAILFVNIGVLNSYYPAHAKGIAQLQAETASFPTPEHIDEGRTTAPSKRILNHVPIYNKVLAGSLMAMDIGLTAIRPPCQHFDQWLTRLEKLGNTTP